MSRRWRISAQRVPSGHPRNTAFACCVFVASTLSSCTDAPTLAPPPTTTVAATSITAPSIPPARADDVLHIGILLPGSGAGATFGAPLIAGARLAIDEINILGGVNEHAVVVHVEDEGSDPDAGIEQLIDDDVDVIVGPASSNVASAVIRRAVDAGIAVCSPTATAISLSNFPDEGLFVRTMPSEELHISALASLIDGTGLAEASALIPDDEYGLGYLKVLRVELESRGLILDEVVLYDPASDNLGPAAAEIAAAAPKALVVVGDLANGGRMLAALDSATDDLPQIFVNEALRSNDIGGAIGTRSANVLAHVTGAAPAAWPGASESGQRFAQIYVDHLESTPVDFAAYAYDCVIAFALAAESTGEDDPALIAAAVSQISLSGQPCMEFAECRRLIRAGRNIDYEGASGPLELNFAGDVSAADLDVFGFERSGEEIIRSTIRAS